jgi:hypothetical protein
MRVRAVVWLALVASALAACDSVSDTPPAPRAISDARQSAPDALIGTWILDVAKSTYAGQPPRSQIRTFDYTRDGLVLCTYRSENAAGVSSLNHWYTSFDGTYHPDFTRSAGATAFELIAIQKIDDYRMEIKIRHTDARREFGTFTISEDGQTLTQLLTTIPPEGRETTNVAVFSKQPPTAGS